MKQSIQKIFYLLLASGFFAVHCFWAPARDYAPGLAVITGIIFAVAFGNPFKEYTSKYTSNLLGATIVGMGCGMNLIKVLQAGANGIVYTLIGISAGLGLGVLVGKRLKLNRDTMYLISVGTSICGGSAIAAAAPVLKAKSHDIAIASATVFTLNAIALLIFPAVGHALNFTETQFGYWAALAIHDTSSVVGAGFQYGPQALEVGTTVKLARALWIVPVTLFISCFVAPVAEGEKRAVKFKVPWFIPGFLIAAAIVTWLPELFGSEQPMSKYICKTGQFIKDISKFLMITTLFLIGSNLSREKLKELGLKPVLHGVILWIILSVCWCAAIAAGVVNCKG
ncbi:MAG: putative sulfate exporter family transporter [Lentisphaeria bacterium]|nr:putative sulfate exporter family transporter [Lentisphaeria bacterium]